MPQISVRSIHPVYFHAIKLLIELVKHGSRSLQEAHAESGAASCRLLKAAGFKVAAVYRGSDRVAERFKRDIGIPIYNWDFASYDACVARLKRVEVGVGPNDILVNDAGITRDGVFHKMTFDRGMPSSIPISIRYSTCVGHSSSRMRERGFGRIINISWINDQKRQIGQTNYAAAKAADIGFTKALAQENARKRVTVNAICRGYIATDMVRAMPIEVVEKTILPLIRWGGS